MPNGGENQFPQTASCVLANAVHYEVDICHCKIVLQTFVQLIVQQHPSSFSAEVLPSLTSASTVV